MPRCQCGAATCACSVVGGDGIDVTGVGTQANPYRVKNLRGDPLSRLLVIDTESVDLTIAPAAPDDPDTPYTLQADATVSMMDLTDVNGADFPVIGDIPVWDGTQWQFDAPGPSLPVGGTDGQVLTKQSSTNGDANWETPPPSLPPGGADGQVLTKQSTVDGDALWESLPAGGGGTVIPGEPVYATSRQHANAIPAVATATNVTIPWDTAQADDGSIPCSSGVFTIPATGWYQINCKVTFPFNATGQRSVRVLRNGASADLGVIQIAPVPVANATTVLFARALKFTAGDQVLVNASQSSGGALDVAYGGISYNSVDIYKIPTPAPLQVGERIYSTSRRQAAVVPAANNTQVVIPWDTLDHADGITCDAAGVFTFPVAGYYQVNAKVAFSSNNTGKREIRALLNGASAVPGIVLIPPVTSASGTNVQFSRLLKVAAGDTLQIGATQTSGVTLDAASAGVAYNSIDITKVPEPGGGTAISGERNYSASRRQAAAVSCTTGTVVLVPWDTEDFSDGIAFAAGVFTVPVAGYYQVTAKVGWDANGSGYRRLRIAVNGASGGPGYGMVPPSASANTISMLTRTVKLAAGDQIQVSIDQTSGVTLGTMASTAFNSIDITKIPAPTVPGSAASGVWGVGPLAGFGSNSLVGREVYVDSAGQLRAKPEVPAPRVSRLKNVSQTLTTASTFYTLTYEFPEEPDSGITYAAGVFTFTVPGVYQVNAIQHFSPVTGDPQLRLSFLVNGANLGYAISGGTSSLTSQSLALSRSWRFAASDTLAIQAFSTQAAQVAYGSGARFSFIDITRISA